MKHQIPANDLPVGPSDTWKDTCAVCCSMLLPVTLLWVSLAAFIKPKLKSGGKKAQLTG